MFQQCDIELFQNCESRIQPDRRTFISVNNLYINNFNYIALSIIKVIFPHQLSTKNNKTTL